MADIINPNITEEKRKRQLAILKASNELLRESKEKALKHKVMLLKLPSAQILLTL